MAEDETVKSYLHGEKSIDLIPKADKINNTDFFPQRYRGEYQKKNQPKKLKFVSLFGEWEMTIARVLSGNRTDFFFIATYRTLLLFKLCTYVTLV